ncbi:DUF1778 domain-containing protein [Roseateles sp.]|uniref:type II toxin-antitoxin system TacA family antitoxin n=1 Tax=Roseateles sp. TaxID=1971397 RepID=UPI002F4128E4
MTLPITSTTYQLHVPEEICQLIDRAAAIASKSRADFMLDALMDAADDDTVNRTRLRMSEEQFKAFEEILDRPLTENAAYQRMMARKAPWER